MHALVIQQLNAPLKFTSVEDPTPGPGEAVVTLKAAALNRRDFWITCGLYPNITLPVIPGSDGAGTVTAVGTETDSSWLNKEVIINPGMNWGDDQNSQGPDFNILGLPEDGTFAAQVKIPVEQLHEKPQHLSWQEAAALPLAGVTAYRGLFSQGSLQANDSVLITGIGGGVATTALQFAVAAGAKVSVSSSSTEKIQRAIELGAVGGFDYRGEDEMEEFYETHAAPNLVFDGAGGSNYGQLVRQCHRGGRIVNYGATNGPPEKLDMFQLFWKQLTLKGSTMGSPEDFQRMLNFVKEHQIKPVIDHVFDLKNGNDAIELMESSPQFGKYVLNINA